MIPFLLMSSPPADLSRLKIDRDRPPTGSVRAVAWSAGLVVVAVVFIGLVTWALRGPSGLEVRVARAEVVGGGANAVGITANGYVVARTRASVSSRIAGRLAFLGVEEGSVVRRGETLARLENAEYEAAVAQAEAEEHRARAALREAEALRDQIARDLVRARELLDKNLEPQRNVEDLEAQLVAAEARVGVQEAQVGAAAAQIRFAQANLENTIIRAPFDGTVLRKDAEVGEVVAPVATGGGLTRGAVVTMADLETLEVEVDVNEAYIAQIRSGQETRIVLDAYPTVGFAGTVRQIVPTADRQRATVQVKVSITDRDPRILPEMGARVEFLEGVVDGATDVSRIFVPAETVRTEGGETIVWVVRNGVALRTPIEAGPVSAGRREVRSGLSGGEMLVVDPPQDLEEGTQLNVNTT